LGQEKEANSVAICTVGLAVGLQYDTADAKRTIMSLLLYIYIANIITKIINSKMLITSTFIWAFT
jgi:hypothetical protein